MAKRARKRHVQLELPAPRTWGGRRTGAGRKRQWRGRREPHRARPTHLARHPLHVTVRAAEDLPSLRSFALARAIGLALRAAAARPHDRCRLRVVEFSIQDDHVHLVVEANDKVDLAHGMRGLNVRLARAVNRELGRRGPFSADRYHARPLRTPTEVRNALVYVLHNWRKHSPGAAGFDDRSSARWFAGWTRPPTPPATPPPVHTPGTWLARVGWKRHGLIHPDARPAGD